MTSDDLLYYYKAVIRPVTEYACAVWHSSITAEQRDQLEAIQRRAVRIIFGKELDFETFAVIHDIPLLAVRRDRQMRQLFASMHDSVITLFEQATTIELCRVSHSHVAQPQEPFARTNGFKNFIFERPFVKRFALCYRSVVCLSVCDVGVLWVAKRLDGSR